MAFRIIEHKIDCQHIREYPQATITGDDEVLYLAVKQYVPLNNLQPQAGDVTIIGAHANGFPKELYESLWEDILEAAEAHNFRIRSIWAVDVAHQGASGVMNYNLLGNDPSLNDHPRDLLHMINLKRKEMIRPIVGIGHSMGGAQLVNLAFLHPRLLTTLILVDPMLDLSWTDPLKSGFDMVRKSALRTDVWPSREAAATSFRKSSFYKRWDPRVLESWIQYGLRETFRDAQVGRDRCLQANGVTLTSTKEQEVFTYLRPNFNSYGVDDKPINRTTHADINPLQRPFHPFYRPEPPQDFLKLPNIRPSILYIFGGKSVFSSAEAIKRKLEATGIGIGGSGGVSAGRVKHVIYHDIGHLVTMEVPRRTAHDIVSWLDSDLEKWRKQEEEFHRNWSSKSLQEKRTAKDMTERLLKDPSTSTVKLKL